MTLLPILRFPDERLRIKAQPVTKVDDDIRNIVEDMLETMVDADGIGLAATQVAIAKRIVVIDIPTHRDEAAHVVDYPLVLINPEIIEHRGEVMSQEGCLSVPDEFADVARYEWIKATYLDKAGAQQTIETDGLLAICFQHEIDHLNGVLFIDYLSKLKQQRLRKRFEKQSRLVM